MNALLSLLAAKTAPMPDFAALSPVHRTEIALVVGCLFLLGFAPKIDRSRLIPALIALAATSVPVWYAFQATGPARLALVVVAAALVVGIFLLSSAELF